MEASGVTPSAWFILALTLLLAPAIASIGYRVRFVKARRGLGVAYGSVVLSYIFSMMETSAQPDIFHVLQHLCYVIAGVGLLSSALVTRRKVNEDMGAGS